MADPLTEVKSSEEGVTNPYRRTENCDKIHAYRMIEGQVPDNHVLLTKPGVGRLAAGITIGIVGDIKRFSRPSPL